MTEAQTTDYQLTEAKRIFAGEIVGQILDVPLAYTEFGKVLEDLLSKHQNTSILSEGVDANRAIWRIQQLVTDIDAINQGFEAVKQKKEIPLDFVAAVNRLNTYYEYPVDKKPRENYKQMIENIVKDLNDDEIKILLPNSQNEQSRPHAINTLIASKEETLRAVIRFVEKYQEPYKLLREERGEMLRFYLQEIDSGTDRPTAEQIATEKVAVQEKGNSPAPLR